MQFRVDNLQLDLGDTPVENIFLNDYMPQADGDFVKVYLVGYQMALNGGEGDNRSIADRLSILESDVEKAWDYWESEGIVEKIYEGESYGIRFLRLKELYTREIYTPDRSDSALVRRIEDEEVAHLLTRAEYYMRREISPQQKIDIADWRTVYNMPAKMILEAFRYGTEEKNKRSVKYIEGIVRNWADANVRTEEALAENFRTHDERYFRYRHLLTAMGLGDKPFIRDEMEAIERYLAHMDFALLEAAAARTGGIQKPNWRYFESILAAWKAKGIRTLADLDKDKKPAKRAPLKKAPPIADSATAKYSADALEDMARRKWRQFQEQKREK
ncbi:DnaD domain protein [Aedoeadaptatus ivorii]|uniref:DnaD domain protein n=1 Tax=Aedoeadaptatus ivorii TaxID=54006 RepID=A0A448UZU5_9FIRM|nr:DnaD domain protein [Peptoniphilus ivorii]MDQ0508534.1 DnaD/phage-associated family protein [Peptoniphilus ivorii]VEJ34362.1 DnaD domain protein [Peptoniphilus ivorii]